MSGSTGNPQIAQGVLNRIRGNIQIGAFPTLNITAPFLGAGGFTFTRTGTATTMIDTLTGRVASPEPFQAVNVEIHLVKSQSLASAWEAQLQSLSIIGPITVFTDSAVQPTYNFTQMAIENVGAIAVNGKSVEYILTLTGTYVINNGLFALVI
jgi:hypothetical protein